MRTRPKKEWTYDDVLNEKARKAKGGTRKVGEITLQQRCLNPSHRPPTHQVFSPGHYEHTCPGCGNVIKFTVPLITY